MQCYRELRINFGNNSHDRKNEYSDARSQILEFLTSCPELLTIERYDSRLISEEIKSILAKLSI